MTEKTEKPTVEVRPHNYQPSRGELEEAELEENVKIETTPERLAQSLLRQVNVREST